MNLMRHQRHQYHQAYQAEYYDEYLLISLRLSYLMPTYHRLHHCSKEESFGPNLPRQPGPIPFSWLSNGEAFTNERYKSSLPHTRLRILGIMGCSSLNMVPRPNYMRTSASLLSLEPGYYHCIYAELKPACHVNRLLSTRCIWNNSLMNIKFLYGLVSPKGNLTYNLPTRWFNWTDECFVNFECFREK